MENKLGKGTTVTVTLPAPTKPPPNSHRRNPYENHKTR